MNNEIENESERRAYEPLYRKAEIISCMTLDEEIISMQEFVHRVNSVPTEVVKVVFNNSPSISASVDRIADSGNTVPEYHAVYIHKPAKCVNGSCNFAELMETDDFPSVSNKPLIITRALLDIRKKYHIPTLQAPNYNTDDAPNMIEESPVKKIIARFLAAPIKTTEMAYMIAPVYPDEKDPNIRSNKHATENEEPNSPNIPLLISNVIFW